MTTHSQTHTQSTSKNGFLPSKGNAKILPILLISTYWLLTWDLPLPFFRQFSWSWYQVLGICGIAIMAQGNRKLRAKPATLYLQVSILIAVGGLLGILRSDDTYQIVYNSVGQVITIVTFFIMIQLVQLKDVRRFLIPVVLIAAVLWSIQIVSLTLSLGELARHEFHALSRNGGHDKNYLALLLAMTVCILLSYALFNSNKNKQQSVGIFRVMAIVLALIFMFVTTLLYSRSGLLTLLLSILIMFLVFFMTQSNANKFIFIGIGSIILLSSFSLFFDSYLQAFPFWRTAIERVSPDQVEQYNSGRVDTLRKSIALIESNPIIGIGLGMYKTAFVDIDSRHSEGTLAHNSYLLLITEGGILVVIAFAVWISAFIRMFIRNFHRFTDADRTLMFMSIPFFIMLAFLDLGIIPFMLMIHSSLYYDYMLEPATA